MKIKPHKRNIVILILLTVITVGFILASIWLINTVNQKRTAVETLVQEISILSNFESSLLNCLEVAESGIDADFEKAFDQVVQTNFYENEFPDLSLLSEKTKQLDRYFKSSGVNINFKPFKENLFELESFIGEEKISKRIQLGQLSVALGNYWNYTHLLIALACIVSIILTITGFIVVRSGKQLNILKGRNLQYMNSIMDCMIVWDNEGIILEYNAAFQKLFDYKNNEAKGMHIKDFYKHEAEWLNVRSELKENEFFKGNVVNINKKGDVFLSNLSANLIYDEKGKKIGSMGISRDITVKKREEEQFQHIVDNATDIIYTTNVEGFVTYVNSSAISVLGYADKEIIGMSFKDLIFPADVKKVEAHYAAQFQSRDIENSYLEFRMLKASGEHIWIGQNVRTTYSQVDPKMVVGFFGILRNLNEIKKVELELLDSELKFRELFDNSKDLIQSVDANGMVLYVNETWKQTLGYDEEDIKTMNMFDIIHKDSRDYSEELLSDILKFGSETEESNKEHLFRMVTKSGDEVVLQGSVSVKYDNGLVRSLQTFFRDVTVQHKIEEELKHSEENFRLISNSINDVFFLYNVEKKSYDYISPNCEDVLGTKPEFFFDGGNYFEAHAHPGDLNLVKDMNRNILDGLPQEVEYRRLTLTDDVRWIDEKWFPIKNENGKIVSISGVCRDVTDMKSAFDTIFEQNKEISQSIHYAKNIQESTLPTKEEINKILPESFVFYKPKDVLSGDLYLVDEVSISTDTDKWPVFVVGDCTGHGVPGGLLSLLCSGLLAESLNNSSVSSPADALGFVRSKLIRLFRSNPSKYILDGMDAAFCALNRKDRELHFAGANLSVYIVRKGEVLEYKGDRQHIGYSSDMAPFNLQIIPVEPADQIYLTTDGYVDQFGGKKNKKFLKKRLNKLLIEMTEEPMHVQKQLIAASFDSWKGADGDQTDDIAMIGLRI